MNGFSGRVLLLGAIVALLFAGSVGAQNGIVSIYKVGGLKGGTTVNAGADVRFLLRYTNDIGEKCDISNGFKVSSPDGAVWDSTTIDSIGPIVAGECAFGKYFDMIFALMDYGADGISPDTVAVLGAGSQTKAAKQLPSGFDDSALVVTVWFDGKKTSAGKHICIDSCFQEPGGSWKWVTKSLVDKFPAWTGLPGQPYSDGVPSTREGSGYCFDIYAPALGLSTDSLGFIMNYGNAAPPNQTFSVTSTGDAFGENLAFTLTEFAGWLVKSPASGTTPRTITVSMNPTGLDPGIYIDSIKVEAAGAGNSPQWVKVTFEIIAPPPVIYVSKSSLNFNALTGGADPAPQTFYIKNTGGMTLSWNLSWASPWLAAGPTLGTDSNTVTVSPSILGLGPGDHYDTITVAASGATNSPVKIPVKLSLGSNLPMIATDSAVYHVIVDAPNNAAPRTVNIFNGGIGSLSFTLSSASPRIMGFTPNSGTAPKAVTVSFKILGGVDGQQYWDTLWATSPEAVNSPFPIVFHSMIIETPPALKLSKDTISFVTFDCMDLPPASGGMPADSFFALDTSGADRMFGFTARLLNTSEFCTITPSEGEMPVQFTATGVNLGIAPGVYYDTILVGVDFAYHSPDTLIVKYTRYYSGPNPQLSLSRTSYDIPRQAQTGPGTFTLSIRNMDEGCLPWTISENVPWFTPKQASGNVPAEFQGVLETNDLTLGTYTDSFAVVAPTASNSPQVVQLKLRIWTLRGDCNWNGFINLTDLSWLIAYLVWGGQMPQPEYAVGDVDCSGVVDLADLSRLISYLVAHATLCGNP